MSKSDLSANLENSLDEIDAAVFSGDSFFSRENIARLRHFTERWNKELVNIERVVEIEEKEQKCQK